MSDHDHAHGHHHDHGASTRAIVIALALTAVFALVEAAGGFWAQSLALISDAGHNLRDAKIPLGELGGTLDRLLGRFIPVPSWIARRPE